MFAALAHACRYCGLLDASAAAHRAAVRLDPTVASSVLHTYYQQRAWSQALDELHRSSDPFEGRLLAAMGRRDEAIAAARREEGRYAAIPLLRGFATALRAGLEGDGATAVAAMAPFDDERYSDGEMFFYVAEVYALVGESGRAFAMLDRTVDGGFLSLAAFENNTFLAPLRSHAAWAPLVDRLRASQASAAKLFDDRRGRLLLGLLTPRAQGVAGASGDSSRSSQALANFQSRITVSADTPSTSAVSSTLNPPK